MYHYLKNWSTKDLGLISVNYWLILKPEFSNLKKKMLGHSFFFFWERIMLGYSELIWVKNNSWKYAPLSAKHTQ